MQSVGQWSGTNATPRNKETVVRHLLACDDVELDAVDYENMTALMWAIERRQSTIAELLADRLDMSRADMIQQFFLWFNRRRILTPSGTGKEDYASE